LLLIPLPAIAVYVLLRELTGRAATVSRVARGACLPRSRRRATWVGGHVTRRRFPFGP